VPDPPANPALAFVLDCADPESLGEFWAEALGYAAGRYSPPYLELTDPQDRRPPIILQMVPEAKSGKNRMHLDLWVPSKKEEIARLEQLGARRLSGEIWSSSGKASWVVMGDPEGNEFCVCEQAPT
jgi:predicted enzyme related to lactoylglutathione lyase